MVMGFSFDIAKYLTMLVQMLVYKLIGKRNVIPGEVLELPDIQAARYVAEGQALLLPPTPVIPQGVFEDINRNAMKRANKKHKTRKAIKEVDE